MLVATTPEQCREFAEILDLYASNDPDVLRTAEIRLNRLPVATRIALFTEFWNEEEERRQRKIIILCVACIAAFVLLITLMIAFNFKYSTLFCMPMVLFANYANFATISKRHKAIMKLLPNMRYPEMVPHLLEATSIPHTVSGFSPEERAESLLSAFEQLDHRQLNRRQRALLLSRVSNKRAQAAKVNFYLAEPDLDFVFTALQILVGQSDRTDRKRVLKEIEAWTGFPEVSKPSAACLSTTARQYQRDLESRLLQDATEKRNRQAAIPLLARIGLGSDSQT